MFKRLATIAAVLFSAAAIAFLARPAGATQWDAGARAADEAYWAAYNRGDADAMNAWLSLDVEFYHDRGGKLIGKKALAAANDGMKTNKTRLRREAIPGTVRFYPMREGDTVYGAMVVGEHRFYAKEGGKPEELVGRANYTHLMRLEGNRWRIARIFSFEHVDAP
ncbi:nuclear transport factor 2 family protein [Massilia agri]|uniref:Nuclear transport factor 2 family protein n=1 Tax=Massilia agri TaxID=1886785 RepID=A0ABT2AQW9_9BURK|nr:nuclear transport factor 2 family protein [Massilia agri]MCS0598642.1 nuclear transport factor 2 family protein [Massilia agri]